MANDNISALLAIKNDSGGGDGLTDAVKQALLQCFEDVAWVDDDSGAADIAALEAALYPAQSISAVYTQSGVVYTTDSLDSLKSGLVVTATLENGSTMTVPAASYTLSGSLTEGTSTITVSFGGQTTTFTVMVTESPYLYLLEAETSFNGTNDYIDTGVYPYNYGTSEGTTILVDFTPTNAAGASLVQVFSAMDSNGKGLALNIQSSKAWGGGMSYDNRISVANNTRYRAALSVVFTGRALATSVYNVSGAASAGSENATGTVDYLNDLPVVLGFTRSNSNYWAGTIHKMVVYNGLISSDALSAWLNSGTIPR